MNGTHIQISYRKYPKAMLYVFLLLRQEVIIKIKLKQLYNKGYSVILLWEFM